MVGDHFLFSSVRRPDIVILPEGPEILLQPSEVALLVFSDCVVEEADLTSGKVADIFLGR